jgi:hypothetical protein
MLLRVILPFLLWEFSIVQSSRKRCLLFAPLLMCPGGCLMMAAVAWMMAAVFGLTAC